MKRYLPVIIAFSVTALLFQGCSKIDEPYYTIKAVYVDTTKRSVLLEDYTGHLCVNCAPAGKQANSLQETYKGQVYVIAVHAGSFARPSSDPKYYPYLIGDYTCQTGNDWNDFSGFQITQNPSGMVNRLAWKGKPSFVPSEWTGAIQHAVTLPKVAIMSGHSSYNSQNKLLTANVYTDFIQAYPGPVTLTVCMLEDSIYGGQLNIIKPDSVPIIKNYLFMHVLRGSLNGSFGEKIADNPKVGDYFRKSYTLDFTDKPWIPGHCSVVAFISDANTKEILHVTKAEVKIQ